jgi:hypothetical protein
MSFCAGIVMLAMGGIALGKAVMSSGLLEDVYVQGSISAYSWFD